MFRTLSLLLLLAFAWSGPGAAQDRVEIPAHILAAGERAIAPFGNPVAWSASLQTNIRSSALGCKLLAGLPLPYAIEVYRLEATIDNEPIGLHVSADGSMTQLCDDAVPNLGAGLLPRARDPQADADGDAIENQHDACPTIAGVDALEWRGCPHPGPDDSDGDGSPDSLDACPLQAGPAATGGCALLRDADGDGVPDANDICAHDFGIIRDDFALGCPADGSGSSTHRRADHDACSLVGEYKAIHESASESSYIIGVLDPNGVDHVIARSAAGDWIQLERGWSTVSGTRMQGACYNIPLVDALPGASTGCYLRPASTTVNVRTAPQGKHAARISPNHHYPALGQNISGDWLFFRLGWVSRSVLELSGTCDALPVLDPSHVSSGAVHFCPPEYVGFLPPRIGVGESNARVASHTLANRLRAAPRISAEQIGEIPPRSLLGAILDGPACESAFVWWQVQVDGQVGWTVESDLNANYYYLEPAAETITPSGSQVSSAIDPPAPTDSPQPATGQMISSANLHRLDTVEILRSENPQHLEWSAQQSYLAILSAQGAISLFAYPSFNPVRISNHLPDDLRATAIAFNPDESRFALGTRDGRLILVELRDSAVLSAGYLPQQLHSSVRVVTWSNSGNWLAAASGDPAQNNAGTSHALFLWEVDSVGDEVETKLRLHYAFPYPLTDLAFSADDRWLAVTGESAQKRRAALWVYDGENFELAYSKSLVAMQGSGLVEMSPATALGDFVYSNGDSLYHLDMDWGSDARFYHLAGSVLPQLRIRPQIIPGAEILFALSSSTAVGASQLSLFNALNTDSPQLILALSPSAMAFSPDGRILAAADPAHNQVLLLGVIAR